jgi:arabinofuranosyltransferase
MLTIRRKIIIIFSVFFIFLIFFSVKDYFLKNKDFRSKIIKYEKKQAIKKNDITAAPITNKEKYLIFGRYMKISEGKYRADFFIKSRKKKSVKLNVDIASDRGREIEVKKEKRVKFGENIISVRLLLKNGKEIEPRVKLSDNFDSIYVEKVKIEKIGNIFPAEKVILKTVFYSFFSILFVFAVLYSKEEDFKGKKYILFFLLFLSFYLILVKSWISEDAFITLRHIENFISGYGPVFNIGERVEGFSHVLWFYMVSFFRWLGFTIKASVMIPSLIFSFSAIYIFLFKIKVSGESGEVLNLAAPALLAASAFIDFGTSGLESPLSYLLLIIYSKFLLEGSFDKRPEFFGIIIALLVFTRPDFGIFLIINLIFFIYELYIKKIKFNFLLKFSIFSIIPLLLYEIFRMGYYAAIFPNPFYTKTGSGSYFSAGINYFLDFSEGSLFLPVVIFALLVFVFNKSEFNGRKLILLSGFTHLFFIVRGGGDFMHGRFLLPSFILLSAGTMGIFDKYFSSSKIRRLSSVFLIIFIFIIGLFIKPAQKRGHYFNRGGISDERFAYYKDKNIPLKYLFKENIIFMWKTIGENYYFLAEKGRTKIRIAYKNVGFIGYYGGKKVFVLDKLGLTDPIVSRLKIKKRGRPGHEKYAPFPYLYYRRLTFSPTPFPLWNRFANTNYGILWDISPKTIRKFSFFLRKDFKRKLDNAILDYLDKLNYMKADADFLIFLSKYWLPYTKKEYKNMFLNKINMRLLKRDSKIYGWINRNKIKLQAIDKRIKGDINYKSFISNIMFSIKNFNMQFE